MAPRFDFRLDEVRVALSNAERFTLDNGTDELNVRRADITPAVLSLANGYKANGGEIYINQTLDLKSICFDVADHPTNYDFFSWCMKVCSIQH